MRIVDYAIIDDDGRRFEFDFGIGWREDVAELIAEIRPARIFAGHYADTRQVTDLADVEPDASAGVYRYGNETIVYITE